MALQDEMVALRRLFETVNKQGVSNAQSISKLMQEQTHQKTCHDSNKLIADRALQMCDQLAKRLDLLEAEIKRLGQSRPL